MHIEYRNAETEDLIPMVTPGYEEPDCFACHDAGCVQCATHATITLRSTSHDIEHVTRRAIDAVQAEASEVAVEFIGHGRGAYRTEWVVELNLVPETIQPTPWHEASDERIGCLSFIFEATR